MRWMSLVGGGSSSFDTGGRGRPATSIRPLDPLLSIRYPNTPNTDDDCMLKLSCSRLPCIPSLPTLPVSASLLSFIICPYTSLFKQPLSEWLLKRRSALPQLQYFNGGRTQMAMDGTWKAPCLRLARLPTEIPAVRIPRTYCILLVTAGFRRVQAKSNSH